MAASPPDRRWSLGPLGALWVEQHCVIPDREDAGQPFELYRSQFRLLDHHYELKPTAQRGQLAPAFRYRRSLKVGPQKSGKSPMTAALVCLEGVGPCLFDGWADGGELYDCRDHGCGCGWVWEYEPGEPMGRPWATPLIQITATSEEQTDNIYDALRPMIDKGPLSALIPKTGEEFIRLPGGGRIDVVTSSATSRLGQRVTFVPQDEAMDLRTSVPTPTGWTTMGELQVGDLVLGADGRPVKVVKATDVQHGRSCYRLHFADGTSVVTSDGHLWQTKIAGSKAKPKVRTTGEMFAATTEYACGATRRFRIPAAEPYDLPDADLPVHPYFLGAWLGDGSTGKAEIACGEQDVEAMEAILAKIGVYTRRTRWAGAGAHSLLFSAKVGFQGVNRPQIAQALQALPCYRSKHIPAEYLRGSRNQRQALLQGLMDTDGHVTETGFCTFTGNEQLAGDVVALLRTLGVHAQAISRADPRAKTGFGWKVNFTPRRGLMPFRLPRKVARVRQAWSGSDWVTITRIEPVESVPVRCIGVDSDDHLFLAGEGAHVTHNTGLWTVANRMVRVADTQYRGLAGMGGRAVLTTNGWDPAEHSVAQREFESGVDDVYRDMVQAPPQLSYGDRRERRQIHRAVYEDTLREHGGHVDLAGIEAEAVDLIAKGERAQAERFFGNRIVAGLGSWLEDGVWAASEAEVVVEDGADVCLGFDGSDSDDWTAIRAETIDGHRFTPTYGPDSRPTIWNPGDFQGRIPRREVQAAVAELFTRYRVARMYCDPPYWQSEIGEWALEHGEKVVVEWPTYRTVPMHGALTRTVADLLSGRTTHDACTITATHVANARKAARPGDRYLLTKPEQHRKIDAAMADVLAGEAAADAREAGWGVTKKYYAYTG